MESKQGIFWGKVFSRARPKWEKYKNTKALVNLNEDLEQVTANVYFEIQSINNLGEVMEEDVVEDSEFYEKIFSQVMRRLAILISSLTEQ